MKIDVSHGRLEANLREAEEPVRGAAVVCHPHPLYGGTMHTKAVFRTAQALNAVGIHALRFNFRGVGASTGSYDEGVGERDDARAALDWLADRFADLPLVMGGFSFGSRVGLSVGVEDPRVDALVGLGVAVDLYDFSFLMETEKPLLVIQGEDDEFGPGARVRKTLEAMGDHITVEVVPGADHYFHDRFDELRAVIRSYFGDGPGARVLLPDARAGSTTS